MLPQNQRNLVSFVSFNLGWWVCFLGPKYGYPLAGPIYAIGAVALHLRIFPNPKGEALYLLAMTVIGAGIDSLLMHFGVFQLLPVPVSIAPLWLIAMWTLFATSMESMEPLRRNRWVFIVISAITGPFSYFCGEALGRLQYNRPLWIFLTIHGLLWAILMPALYVLRDKLTKR